MKTQSRIHATDLVSRSYGVASSDVSNISNARVPVPSIVMLINGDTLSYTPLACSFLLPIPTDLFHWIGRATKGVHTISPLLQETTHLERD